MIIVMILYITTYRAAFAAKNKFPNDDSFPDVSEICVNNSTLNRQFFKYF